MTRIKAIIIAGVLMLAVGGCFYPSSSAQPTTTTNACPAYPAFPSADCTGVPEGTVLADVNGDLVVRNDYEIVSGKDVRGCIVVNAVGVTVQDSKAECITTSQDSRARNPENPRLTVQDVEVDCKNGNYGIGDRNINVLRADIHHCENGFDADSDMTIKDSYIHDLFTLPDDAPNQPHTDGLQSAVGSNLVIDHNTIYGFDTGCQWPNDGSCNGTSAVNVNNTGNGNTTISNNLLAGGAYTLYCPVPPTIDFRILGNHFSTVYSPKVGEFGHSTDCGGEIQAGNVYHETGASLILQ